MKLSTVAVISTLFTVRQGSAAAFQPARFSYETLISSANDVAGHSQFLEVLQTSGLLSITNVNDLNKQEMLDSLHECVSSSQHAVEHTYQDGTVRRTVATQTYQGDMKKMQHHREGERVSHDDGCQSFEKASDKFRTSLSQVTQVFSDKLASLMKDSTDTNDKHLLSDESGLFHYDTISDIVRNGQHLEHFHSYTAPTSTAATDVENTIEWHTDQGLFIVFTPGQIDGQVPKHGGFYIELPDGTKQEVEFGPEDDLVVMLGDGVDQYINPKYESTNKKLRAAPHALIMPQLPSSPRVWYGRMVLPPPNAVHPSHKRTFGDLRKAMIEQDEDALLLGCSSSSGQHRRAQHDEHGHEHDHDHEKEGDECGEGASYCWHRCMDHAAYNVSEASCAEGSLILGCTNDAGHKWPCTHDGNFTMGCLSATADYPPENPDVDPEDCHAPKPSASPTATPTSAAAAVGNVVGGITTMMTAGIAVGVVATVTIFFV